MKDSRIRYYTRLRIDTSPVIIKHSKPIDIPKAKNSAKMHHNTCQPWTIRDEDLYLDSSEKNVNSNYNNAYS